MLNKKTSLIVLIMCIGIPLLCYGESLLSTAKFPDTVDDLSFASQIELDQDGYKPFEGLTPYQALEIIYTDEAVVEQMAADDAKFGDMVVNLMSATPDENLPSVSNNDSNTTASECAYKNPSIQSGQTIPVNKPVLDSDYRLCSRYGWRTISGKPDFHHGIDIGCRLAYFDRPVFTPADGVVLRALPNSTGASSGNYIVIKHYNTGFITKYMHLNTMLVKTGQHVKAGCQIATIGNTGGAKANKANFKDNPWPTLDKRSSHLHYEIHYNKNDEYFSFNGNQIPITKGRKTDPGVVKDHSVDPKPFVNAH